MLFTALQSHCVQLLLYCSVVAVHADHLAVASALKCIQVAELQMYVSTSHIGMAVQLDDPEEVDPHQHALFCDRCTV